MPADSPISGTPTDDDLPEAPFPRPPLTVFFRCVENRAPDEYDGGLIHFGMVAGQLPEIRDNVIDARISLSAKHDSFMHTFPWKSRRAKQTRFFRLTLEEVTLDQVPPDPDAPPELYNADGARVDRNGNLIR